VGPRRVSEAQLVFSRALAGDATELCALLNAVAVDLTRRYGDGHWTRVSTEKGTLRRATRTDVSPAHSSS